VQCAQSPFSFIVLFHSSLTKGSGFNPSIRRNSVIWVRQMKQCWMNKYIFCYLAAHRRCKNQSVCPFVGIGPTHPLPRKRVCLPPRTKGGKEQHSLVGEELRGTQFERLESWHSVCILSAQTCWFQTKTTMNVVFARRTPIYKAYGRWNFKDTNP
jgi:hypothetical protein